MQAPARKALKAEVARKETRWVWARRARRNGLRLIDRDYSSRADAFLATSLSLERKRNVKHRTAWIAGTQDECRANVPREQSTDR